METFNFSILIGGFAFFFYGLSSASKGLELVMGDRLRAALGRIAGNRFFAFGFGAVVTLILQSSGATAAILVSFTETGLLSLFQAAAVMLGADVGTTFVVVLLSIKQITQVSLLIVALGLLINMTAKRRRLQDAGSIIMGFGLIFYGLQLMSDAAMPLQNSDLAMRGFRFLVDNPLSTLILAALLSGVIHSAGTIGIAIAMAFAGALSFKAAVPIVLGANIGTCIVAIMAGFASGTEGRRVALAHTLSKLIGVAIAFPFIDDIVQFVGLSDKIVHSILPGFGTGVAGKIALTHILFNLALAVFFLPLLTPLVKLVQKILPAPPLKHKAFGPKYLDESALDTPALAFAQAKREILRIGATAQWLFSDSLRMFSKGHDYKEQVDHLQNGDDRIDLLEKAVRFYLAQLAMERLSAEQAKIQIALLQIAADFEEIGDIMSRDMAHLAVKKAKWRRMFSDEGWHDLRGFQVMVVDNFNLVMSMLAQPSEEIGKKIEHQGETIDDSEQQLRQAHITRLHQGLREAFDTSSIHLDILAALARVSSKLVHIARTARDLV